MASVTLNWTPWGGVIATSQLVQRKLVGGTYGTIATVGPSINTYIDTSAVYDTGYLYRIVTVCSTGAQTPSGEINVVTGIAQPPNTFYLQVPGAPPQPSLDSIIQTTNDFSTLVETANYFDITWSASLWVRPDWTTATATEDSGITLFGLQASDWSTNYFATNKTALIAAIKNYTGGSILILKFIDSAGGFIQWEYLLGGGANQSVTGLAGAAFFNASTVNIFKHIVITHDHTQSNNNFRVKAYWNGNPLTLTGVPVSGFNKNAFNDSKLRFNLGWLDRFTNGYQGHVLAKSLDEVAFYKDILLNQPEAEILYNLNTILAPYYILPAATPSLSYSFEQPDYLDPNFGVAGAVLVDDAGYGAPSTSEPH
jgi:hypothetical protein